MLVPAVCDAVGIGVVGVADDLVAHLLRLGDQVPETRFAAERLLDRERLGPAAVVAFLVPADQADLGLVDASLSQLVEQVLDLAEGHRHVHGRFRFHGLLQDR